MGTTSSSANVDLAWKCWASLSKKTIQLLPDHSFVPKVLAREPQGLGEVHLYAPAGLEIETM